MIRKEFRQVRRDRRTLALMIVVPLLLLVVFGYVARFDVKEIPTAVVGAEAEAVAAMLGDDRDPSRSRSSTRPATGPPPRTCSAGRGPSSPSWPTSPPSPSCVDGSEMFAAQSARAAMSGLVDLPVGAVEVEVLFNPELSTAAIMVPALIGMVLTAVGTVITSLGVVRERQEGTLEQLAVMPLRPRDVIVGKIAPYFLVGVDRHGGDHRRRPAALRRPLPRLLAGVHRRRPALPAGGARPRGADLHRSPRPRARPSNWPS